MNKLENSSAFASNDIIIVRLAGELATCENCQKAKTKLEELQKENKVGEIIILECKDDSFDEMEKTEDQLRGIAEKWPYFSYIICGFIECHIKSRFRYFADKEQNIKFLEEEYEVLIEGCPPSDFDKDIK